MARVTSHEVPSSFPRYLYTQLASDDLLQLIRHERNQAEIARKNNGWLKKQRLHASRKQSGLTVKVARRLGLCPLAKRPELGTCVVHAHSKTSQTTTNQIKTPWQKEQKLKLQKPIKPKAKWIKAKKSESPKGATTLARKTTSLLQAQGQDLPLQDVVVNTMNVETLTRVMTCKVRRRFKYLLSLFVSSKADTSYRAKFQLSDADTKKLYDNGIIDKINHEDIKGFAWPFCVAELKKTGWRRRMILWPEEGNAKVRELHGYVPSLNLYNRIKYLSSVWHDGPALRVDLKASFYQIPLTPIMSQHLAFWAGSEEKGGWYAFKRLPMGHTLSPEIMQIAMSSLMCDERFMVVPRAFKYYNVDTWLDDARILSTSKEKLKAIEELIKLRLRTCEATVGEWEVSNKYDFIGIHWDHERHMVCNAQRVIEKIKLMANDEFWDSIRSPKGILASKVESLMARIIMASGVIGIDLFEYHFCIKTIRRRLATLIQTRKDYLVRLHKSTVRMLRNWVERCIKNKPQRPMRPSNVFSNKIRRFTICTDASTKGWGGIVYDNENGGISTYGGPWDTKMSANQIAELEARALLNTWEQWRVMLQPTFRRLSSQREESSPGHDADARAVDTPLHVRFMVDSSVLIWALLKRQSRNRLVWKAIRPILTDISRMNKICNTTYSAFYIKSEHNPADEISRLRALDMGKVYRGVIADSDIGKMPEGITWLMDDSTDE
ncbi:unnamed protein product [Trypanosoma congolense IL3000]|uniref:WGS project CAEQ00000000 data, annotated contig 1881 n=1 Tax=Trypanosoma congolense (strain IL3000) TaxID=1068625 RepID=F9W9M9_TRYCI|nr:unnamed protein product [Trypanosoma congolense IL3000]